MTENERTRSHYIEITNPNAKGIVKLRMDFQTGKVTLTDKNGEKTSFLMDPTTLAKFIRIDPLTKEREWVSLGRSGRSEVFRPGFANPVPQFEGRNANLLAKSGLAKARGLEIRYEGKALGKAETGVGHGDFWGQVPKLPDEGVEGLAGRLL